MNQNNITDEQKKLWSSWFEIPVEDMDRAQKFYETVFDTQIHVMDMGGFSMGIFPHVNSGAALCKGEGYTPAPDGVVVYMDASPDLAVAEAKIEAAGGKVIRGKKQISDEHGYMALFHDTEGNRLALHSMN